MKILFAILFFSFASVALASDFCQKMKFEPEFPAGLEGRYEVIGKDPTTGAAYFGYLAITNGKNSYGIGRIVNGNISKGHAWIESCGPDKIKFLVAEYTTEPKIKTTCSLGADGDNNYRATCKTWHGDKAGLEAWFQMP
jgi:hypothetical protein